MRGSVAYPAGRRVKCVSLRKWARASPIQIAARIDFVSGATCCACCALSISRAELNGRAPLFRQLVAPRAPGAAQTKIERPQLAFVTSLFRNRKTRAAFNDFRWLIRATSLCFALITRARQLLRLLRRLPSRYYRVARFFSEHCFYLCCTPRGRPAVGRRRRRPARLCQVNRRSRPLFTGTERIRRRGGRSGQVDGSLASWRLISLR